MINEFQKYLETSPLGVKYKIAQDGVMDESFKAALIELENKIANAINNIAVKGTIISKTGTIKTSLDDVKKSVALVSGFDKYAQATVETLDIALNDPEKPLSLQAILTPGAAEEKLQADPNESQQIGKSQIFVPAALDERFCKLAEISKKY